MDKNLEQPARSVDEVRFRLDKFRRESSAGAEINETIDSLSSVGEVAIFGGMIRDFARGAYRPFQSDVDLVVDCSSSQLDQWMQSARSVSRNRFGGWRLTKSMFSYDIWTVRSTWAVQMGHVKADDLSDLIHTTFFDWDGAVYLPQTSRFFCKQNYLSNIRAGVVDLNLAANPNIPGAIARTFRILDSWKCAISPSLSSFLREGLARFQHKQLEAAQETTLGHVIYSVARIGHLQSLLDSADRSRSFSLRHPR